MPLPPKGDPLRPLHLAASSTRGFGALFLLFGAISLFPSLFTLTAKRGIWTTMHLSAADVLFYFVPGVTYWVCGIFIKRKQLWAIIVALALASLHFTLFLIVAATFAVTALQPRNRVAMVAIGIALGFAILFLQLIVHLSRSLKSIKPTSPDIDRGFEPLPVPPLPIKPAETQSEPARN
jgi:hypothetical protein